jgi:hypothetical protein
MGVQLTKVLVLAALVFGVSASGGAAATPAHGPILGVVPHAGVTQALGAPNALSTSGPLAGASFLTFDANYVSLINQYFTDVAHDSGGSSNVYSAATQYSGIQYQSTFGGSYVDHGPLPANGCNDGVDSVCLTDAQLQSEIQNVLTSHGWHGSETAMFILMTPDGVGSCFDSGSTQCTTNVFCAYHSDFVDSNNEPVIYANEPYDATISGCNSGSSPNNDDADTELNTISHEHNEAITDPFGNAWYAADGNENGDLCAWTFGTPLGGTGLTQYNQLINGDHYWLQQEYSNADNAGNKGCVQYLHGPSSPPGPGDGKGPLVDNGGPVMVTNTTYAIYWLPTPGNTALPAITGTPVVNHALTTSTGSWNGAPTGYSYRWQRCSSAGTGCVDISGATESTYTLTSADGGHTVRSTVSATNVNGASPYVAATGMVVVPIPAVTAAPVLSGVAAVGKKLSTTSGTWNSPVTVAFQWLRCAGDGSGCTDISGATTATYVLAAADGGHTLEARVSATNAAGTAAALSNRSTVVVASPSAKKPPHISGNAKVGKKLSGSHGTWTNSPTGYHFQWLRCNAHGGACGLIGGATHSSYRLASHDAGHKLRLRVTATNAAGSRTATSASTGRVAH